ncbi:hypothetical protein XU18_0763 [Perkinsela sp. CCAP 1560/4]|nr:hypothetical protein XU18_0763 [Perkinsela sp. CCAP 1560/4]|eukprot:KNH08799.1 hypothetical protein XU18_0763 [Perkinsela sp. CCAP 1560/4]
MNERCIPSLRRRDRNFSVMRSSSFVSQTRFVIELPILYPHKSLSRRWQVGEGGIRRWKHSHLLPYVLNAKYTRHCRQSPYVDGPNGSHWRKYKSDFELPYRIRQVLDGIGTVMTIPSCDICNEAMTAID